MFLFTMDYISMIVDRIHKTGYHMIEMVSLDKWLFNVIVRINYKTSGDRRWNDRWFPVSKRSDLRRAKEGECRQWQ